jgi:predicted enzyme related to lactoylglutathione lyase
MRNPVVYFEIPVLDLDRAIAFYSAVFSCELERVALDGNEMANFPDVGEAGGITGALAKGDSYVSGKQGARVYFRVASIDKTFSAVERAGGQVLYPKTSIGAYGWVAEFEDSEGNCIGLSEQ